MHLFQLNVGPACHTFHTSRFIKNSLSNTSKQRKHTAAAVKMPSIYYKIHRDYGPQTVEKDDKSGLKAAKSKQTYE